MSNNQFIARPGQSLASHLEGVANLTRKFASKIGLPKQGELIGLLHDFGKYSRQFQAYIYIALAMQQSDLDVDESSGDISLLKGKIDHSSAGAQWIWNELRKYGKDGKGELCGQILALCVASHHSGLIDCLKNDGENAFIDRMHKADEKTHLAECLAKADRNILEKAQQLAGKELVASMMEPVKKILETKIDGQLNNKKIQAFYLGMLTRFLFSCLIDADRIDSAGRELQTAPVEWQVAIDRLERQLKGFPLKERIDHIRRNISNDCYAKASKAQGLYTLTVPTGGGKTYASLRYALHHAKQHKLDRIIYIIPYTSIIEQNAEAIRKLIEDNNDALPWVLEHHSNLEPEQQTWHSKIASDNWEAPIVLTTMVQFLEVLFGSGTRGARRMHQLANSVLIFDEIQTLPINCTHIFCNALNFLVEYAKTTAILCTATQPLFNELKNPENGQLSIPLGNELVDNVSQLFMDLKRVEVLNRCKIGGWNKQEIVELVLAEFSNKGNCLVIVNTKAWAQALYHLCQKQIPREAVFHLSTNQCATHRKKLLQNISSRLDMGVPVLCICTQLIEAGVDISFATVIRFLAGLDSIAQAAGRCNRHGELKDKSGNSIKGRVYILNPDTETINLLKNIEVGQEKAWRVLTELHKGDLLSPDKMKLYFQYYFFDRAKEMSYSLSSKKTGRDDSLLNLLSENHLNPGHSNHGRRRDRKVPLLEQSFMAAGQAFKAIDAPTQSVIVPYGKGKKLITDLCIVAKKFDAQTYYQLFKRSTTIYSECFSKCLA